ncbi:BPK_HP2_G0044520.mRNA.1.CDS.1 [Saccharomyces cerevisiae]|nr:BPK_HP2_G0044520.mRNA.1.CDS.1 [Saccharomyces cerevisiae]CAI6733170.1 BPK_HP2_G0044520.mRNA.1.CDS.1 [Saccharomyces cerevisiae]
MLARRNSKVDPNIQIKPYQIFPSNNLVYEGLPHPAEQSLILSPDTSLIERAFQALINICKESIPSSNDCTTRNNKSAPQLTVPEPSKPYRLLLVRESRTATELETNKKLWLHSQRKNIEVTVPMHPSEHGTKSRLRKWLSTFVHQ